MPNTNKGALFEEYVYSKLTIPGSWTNLTPYEVNGNTDPSKPKYTHRQFCSQFKNKFDFDPLVVWSKKINPDFVFYNPVLQKVVVLEAKCQTDKGSVDEKLQTSGFKIKQLRKLFGAALQVPAENISYSYLLKQEDFDKPEYKDTFDDIHDNGNEYYFVNDTFSFAVE